MNKRKLSNRLLRYLAKFQGVDTGLFQHEAEWNLADAVFSMGLTEENIKEMESLAEEADRSAAIATSQDSREP